MALGGVYHRSVSNQLWLSVESIIKKLGLVSIFENKQSNGYGGPNYLLVSDFLSSKYVHLVKCEVGGI